ncbi:type II toxin-antitoxin system VapC family toxin [Leptospira sp. 2 VSF19]|uniref:Type II toxin-antitoxin system VapC family toxin n=1 Tax=Leptospira soteropolitanensis TaxID=2950025 RepID=A0AAW5VJZ3_9LEPT|nr:type II toxin-antitoxin system VapC family toxin [Leptospira soteropolitanensis]MCW7492664.1 type II toxin-antitoxin system VapC family toxin [Leptospira soteropolitanensis]MCW7500347.1 type II toxin-antitoxin system VapC family toxin [Leptospira soteropolitanensis]MCW7522618.1 type II toxin-antitoxin system VapC family toxin [Leptospira soteropolitanensis]MCW7526474.1 type II toxin-antitoxin system VapC family toxin [Leptospira soteropolitanensis]MCW7530317.1 type II toxin-antitoxin system
MKYLLDTHTFLWMVYEPEKLSKKVLRVVENADTDLFLSVASIWEIIIKYNLGKLNLHISPEKMISESLIATDCQTLTISMGHTFGLVGLPEYHQDPFDRILVCQSNYEKMAILTKDALVTQYKVDAVW